MNTFQQKSYVRFIFALLFGVASALIVVFLLNSSIAQAYRAPGPLIAGHQNFSCNECHDGAEGSFRQQLQANIQYALGRRVKYAPMGFKPVTNKVCGDCHQRPKDTHPVYRFMEPKYRKVREKLKVQECNTCHREHQGNRVSVSISMCSYCHEKLVMKKDPLDVKHEQLVKQKRWGSCLGCHDFHGNHQYKAPTKIAQKISPLVIEDYFKSRKSPYGSTKLEKARKSRHDQHI